MACTSRPIGCRRSSRRAAWQPLDQYINGTDKASFLNLDDLQPGVSNLTFDGSIYGFPSEGDTAWLFYRTDLLSAAGIQPPPRWRRCWPRRRQLNQPPDRYGLVIGNKKDEAWWDFMHYFWAFGGQLFDPTTYEVTVNNAAGVQGPDVLLGPAPQVQASCPRTSRRTATTRS